tara:strand:+ start:399 stop:1358 length:960 start_codon:yes stop_codon:yes gene_type:complete
MVSILRTNQPFFFIVSAWLILILNGLIYFNNGDVKEVEFELLKLIGAPKILVYFVLFIVVFYTGFLINSVVNKSVLFEKSYYLSGLLYVVFVTSFGDIISYLLPLIGNLFLLLSLKNLLLIFRANSCKRQVFNASIFILFGALFYSLNLFILPLVWIVLFIIRPFVWREYLMPIIVLLISFAYVIPFGILNENILEMMSLWWSSSQISYHEISPSVGLLIMGFISVTFLLSFKSIVNTFIYSNNRYKRVIWVVVAMMVFTILLSVLDFLLFNRSSGGLVPFLIPLVIFLSNGFIRNRIQWVCDLVFILFFVSTIVIQIL